MKKGRQDKILELIARQNIETQDDLIASLKSEGYNVTQATLVFYSIISLGSILLCDLLYGVVDPRIRVGGKKE